MRMVRFESDDGLAPDQPPCRPYRLQHFYMWGLYGFVLPKWHFLDDFQNVYQAPIDDNRMPLPRGWSCTRSQRPARARSRLVNPPRPRYLPSMRKTVLALSMVALSCASYR